MGGLKLKFVAVLLIVALLPSIPVAFTVHALFRRTLDPVLETDLLGGTQAGLEAVRELLEKEKERFESDIRAGEEIEELDTAALSDRDRAALLRLAERSTPSRSLILVGPERLTLEDRELLVARISTATDRPAWVARPLDAGLADRAARLGESVRLVETLRLQRDAVIESLILSFLLVYVVTIVAVVVVGLFLASRVTRPVEVLTKGIGRVASGDLDTSVPVVAGGEMGQLLTGFNDMTARLRSQQSELLRLEKLAAWRDMARRLAHEIKNPLTPIQLAAQQMRDTYDGDDADYTDLVQEGTSIIEEEVDALRNLVTEFSQFARMPQPKRERVSMEALGADVAALYRSEQLKVALGDETLDVTGDREQLHRVLINLINNAVQAQETISVTTPVELSIEGGERSVRIEVRDRGPGVPLEDRQRIFEPDVTTKSDGMGLGLAIVEATIGAHGGTISVVETDGGGALFRIDLPRETQTDERGPA